MTFLYESGFVNCEAQHIKKIHELIWQKQQVCCPYGQNKQFLCAKKSMFCIITNCSSKYMKLHNISETFCF
jgi:hypothetical protein